MVRWLRLNCKWHKWTSHYQYSLIFNRNTEYGRTYYKGTQYYLVNNEGEVAKIPYYVMTRLHDEVITERWGPYVFYNYFEDTKEAQYLKKMFRYPRLSTEAQLKVDKILQNNSLWIGTDEEFKNVLEERERRLLDESKRTNKDGEMVVKTSNEDC